MRGRGLQALLVLALVAGVAITPMPADAAVPTLTGTTVVKGDRSAKLRVRVPSEATLDLRPKAADGALSPAALKTSGGKGHVGFLLTRADRLDDVSVLAVRLPDPLHDGNDVITGVAHGRPAARDAGEQPWLAPDDPSMCTKCWVPAGLYDLHLLTRGEATVTITFGGLEGKSVLRPGTETDTKAWSSTLRPSGPTEPLMDGGGWAMSMGWSHAEQGVLLTTAELVVDPRQLPLVAGQTEWCRELKQQRRCDGARVVAGAGPRTAGSGVLRARNVRSVATDMSFNVAGGGSYRARMSLLWVPTGGGGSGSLVLGETAVQRVRKVLDPF